MCQVYFNAACTSGRSRKLACCYYKWKQSEWGPPDAAFYSRMNRSAFQPLESSGELGKSLLLQETSLLSKIKHKPTQSIKTPTHTQIFPSGFKPSKQGHSVDGSNGLNTEQIYAHSAEFKNVTLCNCLKKCLRAATSQRLCLSSPSSNDVMANLSADKRSHTDHKVMKLLVLFIIRYQ